MCIQPRVMICPLDWGLGHATRMIPLIYGFLVRDYRVIVAGSGAGWELLRQEFGQKVDYLEFPGKTIAYGKKSLLFALMRQVPSFWRSIGKERFWLKQTLKKVNPQLVISDNRYGLGGCGVYSIFVTHQLHIRLPGLLRVFEKLLNRVAHKYIRTFDECWVPDLASYPGLSGELSHNARVRGQKFVGPLSRFNVEADFPDSSWSQQLPQNFLLVILSGPEPQRTLLENLLTNALTDHTVVWFRGVPGSATPETRGSHVFFNHGSRDLMAWCLTHCQMVVCRSGYSTLMDLSVFGKKAVLIPTPGQTEQEYLGKLMQKSGYAFCLPQHQIQNIATAIQEAQKLEGIPMLHPMLNKAIDAVDQKIRRNISPHQ